MRILIMMAALVLCGAPAGALAQSASETAPSAQSAGAAQGVENAAQRANAAGGVQLDARGRAERIVEVMLFESGLFVAMMRETEPYMSPSVRDGLVPRLVEMNPNANREAAAAYAATFASLKRSTRRSPSFSRLRGQS